MRNFWSDLHKYYNIVFIQLGKLIPVIKILKSEQDYARPSIMRRISRIIAHDWTFALLGCTKNVKMIDFVLSFSRHPTCWFQFQWDNISWIFSSRNNRAQEWTSVRRTESEIPCLFPARRILSSRVNDDLSITGMFLMSCKVYTQVNLFSKDEPCGSLLKFMKRGLPVNIYGIVPG